MKFIEIIMGLALVSLGIITSITDVKKGRIYNRTLLIYSVAGMILDLVYYGYFASDLFFLYIANFAITALISLILFYTHSFAGGDCKLTLVMALLYPANYYLVYDKTKITLFLVLCIAILFGYFYLLGFSICSLVKGKTKLTKEYVKEILKIFLRSFISASAYISLINVLAIVLGKQGIIMNRWLLRIICMGSAWVVGRSPMLKKWPLVFGVYMVSGLVGALFGFVPFSFDPTNYVFVIVLLLCQMTIRINQYEEVEISNLKKGMILSSFSSLLMQNSRVRGLPPISTEDLKSRLTEEQVESITRWAKSRKVFTVTIIRKIPFAIFIFAGFISYFIIWSVVK